MIRRTREVREILACLILPLYNYYTVHVKLKTGENIFGVKFVFVVYIMVMQKNIQQIDTYRIVPPYT